MRKTREKKIEENQIFGGQLQGRGFWGYRFFQGELES